MKKSGQINKQNIYPSIKVLKSRIQKNLPQLKNLDIGLVIKKANANIIAKLQKPLTDDLLS